MKTHHTPAKTASPVRRVLRRVPRIHVLAGVAMLGAGHPCIAQSTLAAPSTAVAPPASVAQAGAAAQADAARATTGVPAPRGVPARPAVRASAQPEAPAAAELNALRERTRSSILEVKADQPSASDTATGFSRALPESLRATMVRTDAQPREAAPPVKGSEGGRVPPGLPALEAAKPREIVKRPVSADTKDGRAQVTTPDFSRQSVTFAQLAGRAVIDLPEADAQFGRSMSSARGTPLDGKAFALPDLVLAGLDFSPELKSVKAREEGAAQRRAQARADLLPSVSARYAAGTETSTSATISGDTHPYRNSSLRLTQPVVNYPALASFDASRSQFEAAAARTAASREEVTLSLIQATVNLATARVILNFSDELLANLGEILEYQELRARSGAASQSELERARTRVFAGRQARLEQQANYKNALLEVERLTGVTPRQLSLPFLNQLPPLPRTQAEIRSIVESNHAGIAALRRDIEAQQATVRAQYGRYAPTVVASLEDDRSRNNGGPSGARHDRRALLVVNWAFSLGGKEYFGGRQASAELRELQSRLDAESSKVQQALDADFALLQAASLRISVGQQEQQAAQRVTEAVREQMKVGRLGTLLEALDASERLFDARLRLSQALGQQMIAQAQLLRSMGLLSNVAETATIKVE